MAPPQVLPSVCPLDCPDRCALDVTVDADRVLKIDGSTRSPLTAGYICAKVRRFGERLDGPERVLHPMRRTGPKGSGSYERVSWDDAVGEIATRFRAILGKSGGEAILPFWYAGSNGLLTSRAMDMRFWNRLGASELARTFCAANTGAAWKSVFDDLPGADPADVEHADVVVLWGVNPSVTGIHLVPLIRAARERGAFLAVVDPRRTPLARAADVHLPVLPGTDVAVAMAMIGVMAGDGLADEAFLGRSARGWPALRRAAADWTPERAGALARVDPDGIRRVARALAAGKAAFVRVGWGLERNRNGVDAVRAVLSLRAAAGRFGARGAGVALSTSGGFRMDLAGAERPDLRERPSRTINMSELGRALEEARDPAIEALYVYDANPVATAPNQSRVARAMARESLFTVVHEQVWTDTCDLADVVLPATTFLEHRELCRSYGGYALHWSEPVVPPRGEARANHAVFAALAQAMGFDDPAFLESEDDIARAVLRGTGAARVELEALKAAPYQPIPAPRQFADAFPARGYVDLDSAPGPPVYREPPADPELPLVLISPSSDRAITSTLFELQPPGSAEIQLAPADAEARKLRAGDLVRARNSFGAVVAVLAIAPELPAGVAALPKGLWRRATRNGWTANALAPDHLDAAGGGACYNDARVEVEASPHAR